MSASLIRSRAMVTHAIDRHRWNEITDGAVLQEDGAIVEIGTYQDLSRETPECRGDWQRQRGDVAGVCQRPPPYRIDAGAARLAGHAARIVVRHPHGDAERQPLPRHALFGVRDDRVGCHDGPASARPYPRKTRSGGPGLRRGDPRLPGCRDARLLLVRGARPEPAGLPAGRGLHRQPAVRAARPDAAMVRAFSIDAR